MKLLKQKQKKKMIITIIICLVMAGLFGGGFFVYHVHQEKEIAAYELKVAKEKKAAQKAEEKKEAKAKAKAEEEAKVQAIEEAKAKAQAEEEAKVKAQADAVNPAVTASSSNVTRPADSTGNIVCIDPGHQAGADSSLEPNGPGSSIMKARVTGGTSGVTTGVSEYQLTLTIGELLKTKLQERGYTVYMTRESADVNMSNMERAQYATSVGANITIRLHADGSTNSSVNGASALCPGASNPYIANLSADSSKLSSCILNAYCQATGMNQRGVMANDTMTGINWSTNPVTILEMGFMTNSTDDINMESAEYQGNMVNGIANGVDAYFGR